MTLNLRAVSLFFAFTFAALSVQAQGPPSGAGAQSLADRLAAVEARVAKLEGNITAADLAGKYAMVFTVVDLSGHRVSPPRNAAIATTGIGGTLTLNADGTFSSVFAGCSSQLTRGILGVDFPWVRQWSGPFRHLELHERPACFGRRR